MSEIAIRVSNLGKQYKIGTRQKRADTLRDALVGTARGLASRFGRNGAHPDDSTFWALKDVSFEVKRGEVLGIIGRNGAGKSTLLKILSRITEPTTGGVDLHGRVASLLEVGTGFHAELTGRENIYLNGAILGMKRREILRNFDEIVDFAGVEQFIDTPVKHYSSGMYLRLAFAVAAHLEPEILLVDEVLAVGDAEFQKKCLGKMGEVAKAGRTVVLVSHNMMAIRSLCHQVVLLEAGDVARAGPADATLAHYLEEAVLAQTATGATTWAATEGASSGTGLHLLAAHLQGPDGRTTSQVDVTESLDVVIEFEVTEPGMVAGATVLLYHQDEVLVLSSISNHSEWHGRRLPCGVFRCICRFPANFLNSGQYSVSLLLWKDAFYPITQVDRALWFEVVDSGKARFGYFHQWSGVIRPFLDWTIQRVE